MPRTNKGRTVGAEDRMRANIARHLNEQDRSVAWLERRVREAGWDMPDHAIWKMLNADRAIRVNEAIGIAHALGTNVTDLVAPIPGEGIA